MKRAKYPSVPAPVRQRIKELSEKEGVHKRVVADALGVSPPTLYKIIGGKNFRVSQKTLRLINKFDESKITDKSSPKKITIKREDIIASRGDTKMIIDSVTSILESSDIDSDEKVFACLKILG